MPKINNALYKSAFSKKGRIKKFNIFIKKSTCFVFFFAPFVLFSLCGTTTSKNNRHYKHPTQAQRVAVHAENNTVFAIFFAICHANRLKSQKSQFLTAKSVRRVYLMFIPWYILQGMLTRRLYATWSFDSHEFATHRDTLGNIWKSQRAVLREFARMLPIFSDIFRWVVNKNSRKFARFFLSATHREISWNVGTKSREYSR